MTSNLAFQDKVAHHVDEDGRHGPGDGDAGEPVELLDPVPSRLKEVLDAMYGRLL